ncbi:MAG: transposase [Methylococcaceae bacterium]|jgi:hypothetical protein
MDNKGYGNIPSTLFECITFLVRALPIRCVPTFIELLVGAMITQAGFVTEAWLAINPVRSWSAYYKWLQQGKWSWVALGVQMARLVVAFFPQPIWFIILDDTFIYRSSRKAPDCGIHHQHGNKSNRPQYALGQCWVSMALSISADMKHAAIPLLSRLMRTTGNSSKLDAAKVLLRVIAPIFAGKQVVTLVDSWFMKWPYLQYVLQLGFHAIGQVRKDTALFGIPVFTGRRGKPRTYGDQYDAEAVNALPETREWVFLYGKWQWVRYRSAVCLARFMKGRKVRAIWMQFEDENGVLSKQRLLLSTLSDLLPQQIFVYYGRRWSIEDLFNQMKNRWGWKDAWQQSRQVLHRWTQILSIAYALPQLLATYCGDQVENLMDLTPWRKKTQITAGRVRLGMQNILGNVRIREWWNPKYRKFQPPIEDEPPPYQQFDIECRINPMSENNIAESFPPPS